MRLRKVGLRHFRPYYGEVSLEFPESVKSDFYLIHGQNGHGKTSLLNAVQWALFGEGRVREVFEHLNTRARSEQDPRISVELLFEHGGDEFRLVREAKAVSTPVKRPEDMRRSDLTLYRNGTPVTPVEVAQDRIESIIPRDASQFFLFDAEKNNRYSASQLTDETRQAIELVLGMRPVQNAFSDAETLLAELRRKRNQELRRSESHAALADQLELLQEELVRLKASEQEQLQRIKDSERQRDEYRTELDALTEVEALASERRRLEETVREVEQRRDQVIEQLQKEAQGLYLRMLHTKVTVAYEECLASYEALREQETSRRLEDSIRRYLVELSSQERCVCGRPMDREHQDHVRRAAESVPTGADDVQDSATSLTEIAARLELLRAARSKAETAAEHYAELQVRKLDLDEELSDYETKLTHIKSEISSLDLDSVNSLRQLTSRLEEEINLMHREHGGLIQQIEQKGEDLAGKEREISKLASAGAVVAAFDAQMSLLARTGEAFDALLEGSARARRTQIEERANDFFGKITNKNNGYKEMFIADDFTFGIRALDNSEPDMDLISEGEKQVIAFCFVMGLNRYAKASAPLMIDTPMARLDTVHRQNIARALGELGQQAMLFVTDADLLAGVDEIFSEFVEREFEIVHDQETLTSTIAAKGDER